MSRLCFGPCPLTRVTAVERPRRGGPHVSRAIIALGVGAVVVVATIALAFGVSAVTRPAGPAGALPAPRFVEEALAAGVEHAYEGEFTFFVGGGVAAFDCDGDRRPELYLAGGAEPAALFRNRTESGGALRFERAADPVTDLTSVTGAYPLDIDGDRLVDLVVLRRGENMVLRGLGDCRFERANEALGFAGGDAWTVGFSATWETPAATLPTLAFGDYVTLDERESAVGCPDNQLIRPTDGGTVYARAGRRSHPAGARSRCCSATGIGPAGATCASRTTVTTTRTARSSSGGSSPASRRGYTGATTAGRGCRSGGWASPART